MKKKVVFFLGQAKNLGITSGGFKLFSPNSPKCYLGPKDQLHKEISKLFKYKNT